MTGIACDCSLLTGYVQDISATGVCLSVQGGENLVFGDHLREVRFKLPGGEFFLCNLEVRYLKAINAESRVKVGCVFTDLDWAHQHQIERSVAALNRERLFSMDSEAT